MTWKECMKIEQMARESASKKGQMWYDRYFAKCQSESILARKKQNKEKVAG